MEGFTIFMHRYVRNGPYERHFPIKLNIEVISAP